MPETIFVISDLHLGGDESFAICQEKGQRLLAEFLAWVASQHSTANPVHLVVNGDSVDFLSEREFAAFSTPERVAMEKLSAIFDRTRHVWEAFHDLTSTGAEVSF